MAILVVVSFVERGAEKTGKVESTGNFSLIALQDQEEEEVGDQPASGWEKVGGEVPH